MHNTPISSVRGATSPLVYRIACSGSAIHKGSSEIIQQNMKIMYVVKWGGYVCVDSLEVCLLWILKMIDDTTSIQNPKKVSIAENDL
jgi:hypothetical protein